MDQIKLRNKLEQLQKEYNEIHNCFNIFTALHNKHDEKRLHSRFISYLLSDSKHEMGNKYLELFLKTISSQYSAFKDFCLDSCVVRPNEINKSEHRDIDIYITNKKTRQAIIIENKIYAGDSTHEHKIGAEKIQLNRYRTIAEEEKFKSDQIFILYLTLDRHDPERIDEINRPELLFNIDYPSEIISWLDQCIAITANEQLKGCIIQYRSIVTSLTSDLSRVEHLRLLISDNIDLSWDNISFIKDMPDFNHVKWHTIADFWNDLSLELENNGFNVTKRIAINEITKIAHSQSKKSYGINIKSNEDKEYYIVNDFINGLTCGTLDESNNWMNIQMISFVDFEVREVFQLINLSQRRALIAKTVYELKKYIQSTVII